MPKELKTPNAINAVIISDKTGTVEYSIKNPSSFLKMEGNYVGDWIFNGSMNTLWNKSKTIYDYALIKLT